MLRYINNKFFLFLILLTTSILLDTDQVEHSVGMACEFGHLGERGILPNQDLVLRISMCADLQKRFKDKQTNKQTLISAIKTSCKTNDYLNHTSDVRS